MLFEVKRPTTDPKTDLPRKTKCGKEGPGEGAFAPRLERKTGIESQKREKGTKSPNRKRHQLKIKIPICPHSHS